MCGEVEVEDHSVPPDPAHVALVRDVFRQQLAAVGACSRPFRLHLGLTIEPAGLGRVRATMSLLVYRPIQKGGALAGEVPTTLTGDRSSASDVVATEALLRVGAEHSAQAFSKSFP
jgi:hypothetical protein